MDYSKQNFKIPKEEPDYQECSKFIIETISKIIENAIKSGNNKIVINTNLKRGLPMENINKVAGPFVESWAHEIFSNICEDENNKYQLVNVDTGERLNIADIVLQFQKKRKSQSSITSNVDVKATAENIKTSGRSPNITSYARIRCAYLEDPDYMFIILSLKHKVYSKRDKETKLMNGIMEIVSYNAYDLKNISSADISYNPALGTGQIQIKDINYVKETPRTTWEFCQLLDRKYIASKNGYEPWIKLAKKYEWIKNE